MVSLLARSRPLKKLLPTPPLAPKPLLKALKLLLKARWLLVKPLPTPPAKPLPLLATLLLPLLLRPLLKLLRPKPPSKATSAKRGIEGRHPQGWRPFPFWGRAVAAPRAADIEMTHA